MDISLSVYDEKAFIRILEDDRSMRKSWQSMIHVIEAEYRNYEHQIALISDVLEQIKSPRQKVS